MNPDVPRRWILVSRGAGVPGEEDGAGRWSSVALFLDQDAIPTLVEVKHSSDNRTRREVIGHMLDYATNALVYLPIEALRAQFAATCMETGQAPDEALAELLEDEIRVETFWKMARQNLQAQWVRLVFVADVIPPELQQMVEFLNGQMNPAAVIAVEVRQYGGEGWRALVPRVVVRPAAARQAKTRTRSREKRMWDQVSFFAELENRRGPQATAVAKEILNWAEQHEHRIKWGQGPLVGTFAPTVGYPGGTYRPVFVRTSGSVTIDFQNMRSLLSEAKRLELLRRLNEVPGVAIRSGTIAGYPVVPLSALVDSDARRCFLDTLDWLVAELRASSLQE